MAELLGVSRPTIGKWLSAYEQGGLSLLLEIRTRPNRAPCLTASEEARLKERLDDPAGFEGYGEVQAWIETTLKKALPYSTVHGLVRYKLKAKLKTPRKSHVKKDAALLERFKKTSLPS